MTDLLERYRAKRDFTLTPEPKGRTSRSRGGLSFVIQKHAARQLHYDFRLELDGTLKSWAVPKGPSLDPADKRMAVHVEDHPLSYGDFEGVIPPGQYGAGTVVLWDRGRWHPVGDPAEGYRAGKLKFTLDGEKLQGGWTLVRMRGRGKQRQESWLLMKERDEQARPASKYSVVEAQPGSVLDGRREAGAKRSRSRRGAATTPLAPGPDHGRGRTSRSKKTRGAPALPEGATPATLPLSLAPQLATLVERPPKGDWLYEIKFDGYRVLARVEGDDVRLFTRNGNDWSSRLPALVDEVRRLGLDSAWLDGEIVVLGANGASDFNALQNAFDSRHIERVVYCLFDIPYVHGHDLRKVPLHARRALLETVLEGRQSERIRFSQSFEAPGNDILGHACRLRLEGVVGKRPDAPYVSRRSPNWIKLKCTHRQEFVIVGYTDPAGSRVGIGSLLLGVHDDQGRLRYAGKVGTGFDARTLKSLAQKLKALATDRHGLEDRPRDARGHWVQPRLVAEVSFSEWTPEGRIRHASFHGLRDDKPPGAIVQEKPAAAPSAPAADRKSAPSAPVRISHGERIIDASTGFTKRDLVDYYLRASERILPHLRKRPVALVRAPQGIGHHLFFQKHAQTLHIPELVRLDVSLDPGHPPLIEVDSLTALVGAAQMNVVEFHTWNATSSRIDQPDRMTFDLDPGEGVEWAQVAQAAELTRAFLDELGLASFLKTSGGKGLHLVVPLTPRHAWDAVRDFSHAVVRHLARTLPDLFVAKSGPRNRVGRVFVDYLRNGRGATTAAAWSVRARPGLGVSMPCAWDELPRLRSGAHWTIANAHERLEAEADPWRGYAGTRQTLTRAMKTLGDEG